MEIVIRENINQYMQELKQWLAGTTDCGLEEMGDFFSARIDSYEKHMAVWDKAYEAFAKLVPTECENILDLGCGTGLELDEIWKRLPDVRVTGVDLCRDMLERLVKKHPDKALRVICEDYFQYDMAGQEWEVIISFESLHHFLPDKKQQLYQKIFGALREGGVFILGDYVACCEEEEALLQSVWREKRRRYQIPEDRFVHFDIPLTLEHETALLRMAGFSEVSAVDCVNGATMLCGRKGRRG